MIGAVRKGDLYHPSFAGPPQGLYQPIFSRGTSFVCEIENEVNVVVPPAGFDLQLWTTPSVPYVLEEAFLILTSNCTAGQNPGTPTLKLTLNGADLIGGSMTPWTSTTYAITGANRMMWGLQGDKLAGGLFTSGFPGFGSGDVGAMGGYSTFAALTDGGVNGFWGTPLKLHVEHGSGNVKRMIPVRVLLLGRLV